MADENSLSMYADLIWQSHKDASLAETYFDEAVKAAPDDRSEPFFFVMV